MSLKPMVQKYAFFPWILTIVIVAWGGSTPSLETKPYYLGANLNSGLELESPWVQGVWLPQATLMGGFNWFEPLQCTPLGTLLQPDSRYLRYQVGARLSPYYGMVETTLGVRAIPRFEIALSYQLVGYLKSNVEISMAGLDTDQTLQQTWRSDYFFDRLYEQSEWDYAQWVGIWFGLDLSGTFYSAGLEGHYHLVDIATEFDGKNQDFYRNLPVHKKDFLSQVLLWGKIPIGSGASIKGVAEYQQTGLMTDYFGSYTKEPVRQFIVLAGPELKMGSHRMSVELGAFTRKRTQMIASWSERMLIKLSWQANWRLINRDGVTRIR